MAKDDGYGRNWIIEKGIEILGTYGGGITVRQLYYRLVSIGMPNTQRHYKRVVSAMTQARWDETCDFTDFIDRERTGYGHTEANEKELEDEIVNAVSQVKAWMRAYGLERWSNQPEYIEVWIEKKALQGVFESPCMMMDVGLYPCKGYPSLTYLYDASMRFDEAIDKGQDAIILYFGDYDPSGEGIYETIENNLARMGTDVTVIPMALNQDQIRELGLPGVPPKKTDSRTRSWTGGDVVELDAVEPKTLAKMCREAIADHFDRGLYDELKAKESEERAEYQVKVREAIENYLED